MQRALILGLDALARVAYAAHHYRWLRIGLLAALVLSIGAAALARPVFNEDTRVVPLALRDIASTSVGRYVQVTGLLQPRASYQTRFALGGLTLEGSRYVPMMGEGAYDPLFVLDRALPAVPEAGAEVTLVGKLVAGTGQQPPYYLEVGDPPDVTLLNALARAGVALLAVLAVVLAGGYAIRRADYALSAPLSAPAARDGAPAVLWYGDLGRAHGSLVLREAPASFSASRAEAVIQSVDPAAAWQVSVRRLDSVEPTLVASRHGALPAARIDFEDERGLARRGVIATNSLATRDALIESLRFVGRSG
jgi:hypothetical protein